MIGSALLDVHLGKAGRIPELVDEAAVAPSSAWRSLKKHATLMSILTVSGQPVQSC